MEIQSSERERKRQTEREMERERGRERRGRGSEIPLEFKISTIELCDWLSLAKLLIAQLSIREIIKIQELKCILIQHTPCTP